MKDICFFTFFSDYFYYTKRAFMSVNSFAKFHPDVDLFVYREDFLQNFFRKENPLAYTTEKDGTERDAWFNITTYLGKELSKEYRRVVHFDGDVITTGRWDEVLKDDWDIGAVMNFNSYENTSVGNVTEEMYLQNGIAGSATPLLWDKWQTENNKADNFKFYDCDTLNLLLYNDPELTQLQIKVFDKEKDYYGCKSLGREPQMYIENNELMLGGQKVKAYHHARGSEVEKLKFETLGFKNEVIDWLYNIGNTGKSIFVKGL